MTTEKRKTSESIDDEFEPKRQRPKRLTFDDSKLPDFSCLRSLANFIENAQGLLGNVDMSSAIGKLTYTSRSYCTQKKHSINQFYQIIAVHPTLKSLAERSPIPNRTTSPISLQNWWFSYAASRPNQRTGSSTPASFLLPSV